MLPMLPMLPMPCIVGQTGFASMLFAALAQQRQRRIGARPLVINP